MKLARNRCRQGGFTVVELLAVAVVLLAVLAVVVVPAEGRARMNSETHACRENLRRLAAAWALYTADNLGLVPRNPIEQDASPGYAHSLHPSWAIGRMGWLTSTEVTNSLYVASPEHSAIAYYHGGLATLFRCPADRQLSRAQLELGWTRRARSYAMTANIGLSSSTHLIPSIYQPIRGIQDFRHPPPAEVMLFLEEHPDSISGPTFTSPDAARFHDKPATWHGGGMNMAMADGSIRGIVWTGCLTNEAARRVRLSFPSAPQPGPLDPDSQLLRYHTPRKTEAF